MGLEEILDRILSSRKDLGRNEVLRMIEDKQEAAGGYFTAEAAASIVAYELGVKTFREPFRLGLSIHDLVSGLNDVTVVGRVIIVYPLKTFTRPDQTEGKVLRLLIADKSGTSKVVLWDDKAILAEAGKIGQGQIIRVSHAYVRQGLDGKFELHIGSRGEIQASPSDVNESAYPSITNFTEKIGKITRKHRRTSVVGIVQTVYPISEFKRKDGTPGKVRRLELKDDTGQTTVVVWNERVEELASVEKGNSLRIMNTKVKERLDGRLELHVGYTTQVETLTDTPPRIQPISSLPTRLTKIMELKPKMKNVNVLARVTHVQEMREFNRSNGEKGHVSALTVNDETGFIRLNLWDDKAALSKGPQPDDIILINGAYTRERFGKINLNLGKRGSLTLKPQVAEAEKLPPYQERKVKISDIKEEGGPITVEGTVVTTPNVREVVTYQNKTVMVASFDLMDDTGRIMVSLWRDLVEIARDFSIGVRIELENVFVRRGFSSQLELSSRASTSIRALSKPQIRKPDTTA